MKKNFWQKLHWDSLRQFRQERPTTSHYASCECTSGMAYPPEVTTIHFLLETLVIFSSHYATYSKTALSAIQPKVTSLLAGFSYNKSLKGNDHRKKVTSLHFTVIHFVSISTIYLAFAPVVGLNGTLVEAKLRRPTTVQTLNLHLLAEVGTSDRIPIFR